MIPILFAVATATIAPGPVAPPPGVKLTLVAKSPSAWTMRVENTGAVPYLLAADANLLVLDVTAPGARSKVRCMLPADMRPSSAGERALVIPPARAYAEDFDPRVLCFGPHEQAALAPGATVVAHLGWVDARKTRAQTTAPFVVTPLEGVVPRVAGAREIVSAPFAVPAIEAPLPPAMAPKTEQESAPEGETLDLPKLTLHLPAAGDSAIAGDVSTTVTLKNEGTRPVTMLFRVGMLAFDVAGPTGNHRCGEPRIVDSPIRELFTTLAPRGSASISVLLGELCPPGAFDEPGLYTVRPVADTRRASGKTIGLHTFDGLIIGESPQRVRVRHPKHLPVPQRPLLE